MKLRVGFGYDIHRLEKGRPLILGGLLIPFSKGLLGHSDADVLTHAVCEAILGALCQPDIGEKFPDTDPAYKNIASTKLLEEVVSLMSEAGYSIGNLDITLIVEEPKIAPFKAKIKDAITAILNTEKNNVNIKARTQEGLGPIGQGQAIACYAVVTINKVK